MQRSLLASIVIMSLSACDGKTSNGTPETVLSTDSATSGTESVVETVSVTEPTNTDSDANTADSNDGVTDTGVTNDVSNNSDMNTAVTTIVIDPTTGKPMECVDNDGDGWGWTGLNSCRIDGDAVTSDNGDSDDSDNDSSGVINDDSGSDTSVQAGACIDNDGDGWGWNGVASCLISDVNNETDNTADGGVSDDAGSSTSDGGVSDDAGSSTSDGGVSDDAGSSTSDGGVTDDSGSSTSDGGVSDDSGSSTSDGGISDNAGSGTSDGGISDNAGSGTSDGGISDNAGSGTSDGGGSSQGSRNTDAGSYASPNVGGSVIRQSSLSSIGSNEICTIASNPNDFSDIRGVGDFILHNNAWRTFRAAPGYAWEQCIYTDRNGALAGWNYDWGPGIAGLNGNPSPSGDFYVRSYPEIIFGTKDEFRTSAAQSVTGLPVRVSDMPSFQIDYSYDGPQYGASRTVDASNNPRFPNGTTISGERNVAIESFFYVQDSSGNCSANNVSRTGSSNHTYEVMVWLDAGAERLPAGPTDYVADLTIRGNLFKVYTKGSDPRYIAFVAQNPQTTGTLVWNDFTDWARENAHRVREQFGANNNTVQIQDDWCMANIIVGTEIFWGAGNIDFYNWTITQSR